jgi:hypothetical protein
MSCPLVFYFLCTFFDFSNYYFLSISVAAAEFDRVPPVESAEGHAERCCQGTVTSSPLLSRIFVVAADLDRYLHHVPGYPIPIHTSLDD